MIEYQRTLSKPVSVSGTGLHTGNATTVTFKPAEPNSGIRFVRTDIDNCPEIPADIDHVVNYSRDTTLGIGDVLVRQVEHVMAALYGLEIDNCIVEVTANEPPVCDGSAMPFVQVLQEAGFQEQDAPKDFLVIEETLTYSDPEKGIDMVVFPSDELRITFMVDYRNPALGTQYTSMYSLTDEFVKEYADTRTFCFLSEVEALHDQGMIQGGNLDNAVVIIDRDLKQNELKSLANRFNLNPDDVVLGENGILGNKQLRFVNEPVRHKTLDLIGDLALLGVPLKAHVMAARSGHAAHVALVKEIRKIYKKKQLAGRFQKEKSHQGALLDIRAIEKILPHRYPILLVDKIVDLLPGERVIGIKNVTRNEQFFNGHFPDHPIMPGVLIVEAMAQTGSILILDSIDNPQEKVAYFMAIDNVKFRKPVMPGDQLQLEVELVRMRRNSCKMSGHAFVDGDLVCEAEMMAMVMDR